MKKRVLICILSMLVMISSVPMISYADTKAGDSYAKNGIENYTDGGVTTAEDCEESNTLRVSDENAPINAKNFVYDDENGDWIQWNRSNPVTLYKGQKFYVDFMMRDTWESWFTIPRYEMYKVNGDSLGACVYEYFPASSNLVITVNGEDRFTGYHNVGSSYLATGQYAVFLAAMPCDVYGYWVDDYYNFDIPDEVIIVNVKKLPKPTSVTATAGKKKCVIKFRKSTGATKYEIYRSTKKSSGYKKIATITGNKYTDKKVKKGKRYYYKVRAKRGTSTSGIAYSYYTTPKRSAKIK